MLSQVSNNIEINDIAILRLKLNRIEYELNLEKRKGRPLKVVVGKTYICLYICVYLYEYTFELYMNIYMNMCNHI
jgi:hypothetical protein